MCDVILVKAENIIFILIVPFILPLLANVVSLAIEQTIPKFRNVGFVNTIVKLLGAKLVLAFRAFFI